MSFHRGFATALADESTGLTGLTLLLALSGRGNDDGIAGRGTAAIRDLFAAQRTHRLGSREIVATLTADRTTRWNDSNRGKALTETQLARLLRAAV
jgi:Protein of unknown function (DUF3631)